MNSKIFKLIGVTEEDFDNWCKENGKPKYLKTSKEEFFELIKDKKLIKKDNKLIKAE